jgi:Tol biopolymer transport system component
MMMGLPWSRGLVAMLALMAVSQGSSVLGQSPVPRVELISAGTDGLAANHESGSRGVEPARTRISADGRYVVFESFATNLVCSAVAGQDVFVRDRLTGRAVVASVPWNGGSGNHNSFDPVISADGRYVAFASQASNLVPGDTNGLVDIFLRDLQAGTTTRLSVSSAGEQSNGISHGTAISGDGRVVAFHSDASNLVPGDTNGRWDTFVRDLAAGTIERVSVSTAGEDSGHLGALNPSISADGRYVAFLAQGSLDPSVIQHQQEIYIRDRAAGTTTLVRPTAAGGLSNTGIRFANVSASGRFVAFQSNSDNIVVPDQNGFAHDIFLKDLATGATTLVSQSTDGTRGNRDSWFPTVSADGRYVAFHSWANNLVPGDTNIHPYYDVFVRDTVLGTTTRVNVTPSGGEADGSSSAPSISADGSLVLFESTSANLADGDHNGFQDVFLAGPAYPGAGTGGESIQFASASLDAIESAGLATVSVTRYGPACAAATVEYATADGTATAGADYVAASGTLTFDAGQATQTFAVTLLDDALDEPDETVELTLSNPAGGPGLGSPDAATLAITDDDETVNRPPDAIDDAAVTPEDVPAAVPVRANDTDPDGDPVAVTAFTQGAHGTVADDGTGLLLYTPASNFAGSDTFQYTVTDGEGASDTASVHVTVTPVNDLPVAAADRYTASHGVLSVPSASGLLANDADPDGDGLKAELVDGPAQGALALAPDGSFTYMPPDGFTGSATFTYRAVDPQGAASATTPVTVIVPSGEARTSTCRPVTPAAVHRGRRNVVDFMGEPFLGNRRLGLIEDGTVPCVEVDTMETTRCLFWTADDPATSRTRRHPSGPWLEDTEGRRWAVVGQPVTRDGSLSSGAFIVGTIPDADGSVPCMAASGNDVAGIMLEVRGDDGTPEGTDLSATGILEQAGWEGNFGDMLLQNVATLLVGTTSVPHPDGAMQVGFDPSTGVAWYTGIGAAVNDVNGERDPWGFYYGADWSLHFITVNGVQVPAAKRPSTRSYPPPGQIDFRSRIRWLPVNPYLNIANGPSVDPRVVARPSARFTPTVTGETLSLDATASQGDITLYVWDLEWTAQKPDASSSSPTAQFTLAGDRPPSGVVTLTVVAADGQQDRASKSVVLRDPPVARFTYSLGLNTLWVDASASVGDIVQYRWDLDWTSASPDGVSASPLAEFPVAFEGVPPRSGIVRLTVTARDGQTASVQQRVVFRTRDPFTRGAGAKD